MVNFSLILINFHSLFSLIKLSNSICIPTLDPIVEIYKINDLVYILFSDRVGWIEARSVCQSYDAELAVPNTTSKATGLAYFTKMSNLQFQQFWIGARYTNDQWLWSDVEVIENINFTSFGNNQLNSLDKCMVLKKQFYLQPTFAEQMCSSPKPFICERSIFSDSCKSFPTLPVQSTKINSSVFTIFHSKTSWYEAVAFCRSLDQRLAVVSDNFTTAMLARALLRSRPRTENAWVGGYYYNSEWTWLATGQKMSLESDLLWIPYNDLNFTEACLLLDRHLHKKLFIPSRCENQESFICEKFDETLEIHSPKPEIQCFDSDTEFTIYLTNKTWIEAQMFCQSKNSTLAEPGEEKVVKKLTKCFEDPSLEQKHFWLGGIKKRANWIWASSFQYFNTSLSYLSDLFEPLGECLNLDKSKGNKPLMYGIRCTNEQAFVCQKNLDKPSKCACPCNQSSISVFYNGKTYLALLDLIAYNRVDYYCERFGGKLIDSALPRHIRNYVFSYIEASLVSCCCPLDKINVWLKNKSENSCTTVNLKSNEINTNENCTFKNAYICQIDNCIPPKLQLNLNSSTNCELTNMENGYWYNSCTFACNVGFSHFGPSKFICDAYGWSTRTESNEIEPFLYPECVEISRAHQVFLDIVKRIKFDGYYFIIKEQTNWDKIRDFVMSFVKIYHVSKHFPMGLLTFGKFVEVKIPYNSSDTCEVLTQIYNIKNNKNNKGANYNLAFKEIQNQINMYQPRKRTLIIFITDSENTGESYIKSLHQLKKTHLVYVVGITKEVIGDFDIVAGIELNHRLHAIKVHNHDELKLISEQLNKDNRSSIYC